MRGIVYISYVLVFIVSFFLPMSTKANISVRLHAANGVQDFPLVDPNYIYNQLSYLTSNFQHREAGYVSNQGHDRFAAYWSEEMVKNLQGFGPVVRRDTFPIHGWRERLATLTVTSPSGKRRVSKTINVGAEPVIYANPYSPLPGTNRYNPAVAIPVPNNNLPAQPTLAPVLTPTPTPLSPTSTESLRTSPTITLSTPTTDIVSSPTATPVTSRTEASDSPLPLLIGLASSVVVIGIFVLIAMRVLRRWEG